MANHQSAVKRIRRNVRRRRINGAWRTRVRTFVKSVENAIVAGDKEAAASAFKASEPELAPRRSNRSGSQERNAAETVTFARANQDYVAFLVGA